jgi:Calcineurin-like phosphoesterase.
LTTDATVPEDLRDDTGPFDIVGDVHGCGDELEILLARLGYVLVRHDRGPAGREFTVSHPEGRRLVFVGDLVDRGPRVVDSILVAMAAVRAGGHCVPGNHDDRLRRWIGGSEVSMVQGIDASIADMAAVPDPQAFADLVAGFFAGLPSYLWLDGGRLCVAHASMRGDLLGLTGKAVRQHCVFGEHDTGSGTRVRVDWAAAYGGEAEVVWGHTPTLAPEWRNRTLCIDTGCCFGGSLTALRWPERELVSVRAARAHATREGFDPFV